MYVDMCACVCGPYELDFATFRFVGANPRSPILEYIRQDTAHRTRTYVYIHTPTYVHGRISRGRTSRSQALVDAKDPNSSKDMVAGVLRRRRTEKKLHFIEMEGLRGSCLELCNICCPIFAAHLALLSFQIAFLFSGSFAFYCLLAGSFGLHRFVFAINFNCLSSISALRRSFNRGGGAFSDQLRDWLTIVSSFLKKVYEKYQPEGNDKNSYF